MHGSVRRIGDRFPFTIQMDKYSKEYYQCMEWCTAQLLEYLTDYMYWRGSLRFKDEGMATMCKLAASVAQ